METDGAPEAALGEGHFTTVFYLSPLRMIPACDVRCVPKRT
jgi:hypothetical protein